MDKSLIAAAFAEGCIYIPESSAPDAGALSADTLSRAAELAHNGYALTEEALRAFNGLSDQERALTVETIADKMGTKLNWVPLTRNWQVPTGVKWSDRWLALFYNAFPSLCGAGTVLPCGHFIPSGIFDLSRYTGCPLCGRPFELSPGQVISGATPRHFLGVITDTGLRHRLSKLISSKLPPDATERELLTTLLQAYGADRSVTPGTREMASILASLAFDRSDTDYLAGVITSPSDLLRFLWCRHTGEPRPISVRDFKRKVARRAFYAETRKKLINLHFDRHTGRIAAALLNGMDMTPERMCEDMNPDRQMWVRFIRALRLTEHARRKGFERLAEVLDRFYRGDYYVWSAEVDAAWCEGRAERVLELLSQRPAVFGRRLFAAMLRFGVDKVSAAFEKVLPRLPLRSMMSLTSMTDIYFSPEGNRTVTLATGRRVMVEKNPLIAATAPSEREHAIEEMNRLFAKYVVGRYSALEHTPGRKIYISPELFQYPMPVGDRGVSKSMSGAVPGTRFDVRGSKVRMFLHWGEGLPACHIDMDLSAKFIFDTDWEDLAYYSLNVDGGIHSGDMMEVPDNVGTAEYVELDLDRLQERGVRYVALSCNAYSDDKLEPNLRVGWMSADKPMTVDEFNGVAYSPADVDEMIRVGADSRGLVFGVLKMDSRQMIWFDMPCDDQTIDTLNIDLIESFLDKLTTKITVGQMLRLRTIAQDGTIVESPSEADAVYTNAVDAIEELML